MSAVDETPQVPQPGPLSILGAVLLAAIFGLVSGTHTLGLMAGHGLYLTTTQIQVLVPDCALDMLPVPLGGRPMAELAARLATVGHRPWVLALTLGVAVAASAATLRVMHPGLLPALRERRVARWRLAVAAAATVAVLVAALWPLPAEVMRTRFPLYRAALAGALVWMLWHRRGWLHAVDDPPGCVSILVQLAGGAAVGLTAHAFTRHLMTTQDIRVLTRWLEAGFYSPAAWRELAVYSLGLHAWGGLMAGTLACFVAQSRTRLAVRFARVLLPGMLVLAGAAGIQWRQQEVWQERFHWARPLAEVLALPQGPAGAADRPAERLIVPVMAAGEPLPARGSLGRSVLGLPLTPAVSAASRRFLTETGGRSCAARDAWIQLHDAATEAWDGPRAIGLCLEQLASPAASPVFGAVLLETLGHCADSRQAQRAVSALLDPKRFAVETDGARAKLAQVAWRWDRRAAAEELLATLPQALEELRAAPPPRRDGAVTGRLLRRGAPWPAARVGLMPVAQDGLFGEGSPAMLGPWVQRLVSCSAVTGADGAFRLTGVVDGDYRLVIGVPVGDLPWRGPLTYRGRTGRVRLSGAMRRVDLGELDLLPWRQGGSIEAALPDRSGRGLVGVQQTQQSDGAA